MLRLHDALSRNGIRVPVYEEVADGTEDEFGQVEQSWQKTGTTLATRSYQNRNTSRQGSSGELHRDRAVFFFPKDDYPPADARIEYRGTYYELDSPTEQLTHAVAMGSAVVDENFNP